MAELARAEVVIGGDDSPLQRALGRAEGRMKTAGRTMKSIGSRLTTTVTLPLLAIGGAAAKVGADFEREMSRIEGLVGIASDQVDRWGKDILQLAPRLGAAPQALAEGLFFVTSAGFRGAEAMDVLEQSAKASAAGLGEIATIADTVTSAVNAYGRETLSATRATDILTAAVREGKLEAESIAPVLGNLLPVASAMEISFEQVAGMMAVFSRTGADAASSAVTLQRLMLTLQKNTGPAIATLEEAGLSLADLRDMAAGPEGLIGVMRVLEERFRGNDEALAQIFPNIRAFRGVMNALAQDAGTVDDILDGVADSAGSMETAFNVAAETASFKFQQALAGLQSVGIRIGAVILPKLASAAQRVTTILGRLSPEAIEAGVQIAAIAAVVGPAALVMGNLFLAGSAVVGALATLVGWLTTLTGLFNPITLGLSAIAIALRQQVGSWSELGEIALNAFDSILGSVREVGPSLFNAIKPALNFAIGAFVSMGHVAVEAVQIAIEGWKELWDFIVEGASESSNFLVRSFGTAVEEITRFSRIMAFEIGNALGNLSESEDEALSALGDIGQRMASAAVAGFGQDYVGDFVGIVGDGIAAARERIAAFRRLFAAGGGAGGGGEDPSGINIPIPDIREPVQRATQTMESGFEKMKTTGEDVARSISSSFSSAFRSVVTGSQDVISAFADLAKSILADLAAMIAKAFLFNTIMGFISGGSSLFSGQVVGGVVGGPGALIPDLPSLPGAAHGRPVSPNQPHKVGEQGTEVFVPSSAGNVVPNNQLGGGGSNLLANMPPLRRPQTPREAARDSWWREFIRVGVEDQNQMAGGG